MCLTMRTVPVFENRIRPRHCKATRCFATLYKGVLPASFLIFKIVSVNAWPPLGSSDQSFWQQIQRSGFDSRRYQIFWEVVGLERGPLSLMSTIKELLERKSSGSGLENRDDGRRDPSRWPHVTPTAVGIRHAGHMSPLYPQKLALTSPTNGGRSVGIIRSRTQTTDLFLL
jgi:hypothetical protein